ncbi:hypothetical protein BgiBS90_029167, partial [Biomphalaria glabrata]
DIFKLAITSTQKNNMAFVSGKPYLAICINTCSTSRLTLTLTGQPTDTKLWTLSPNRRRIQT